MNRLIGIIAAALVLGIGAAIVWFFGRPSSADVTIAKMVESCEATHHMEKQTHQASTGDSITFSFCAWPPPSWADSDGYSEIVVRTAEGPGTSEASDADETDYIKIPCRTVQLVYDFGSQGDYQYGSPILAKAGDVLGEDGKVPKEYRSNLPGYPSRDDVVFLHNMKEGLYSVSCVS